MKKLLYVVLIVGMVLLFGCKKCCLPPDMTAYYLTSGPWQLISASEYGSSGVVTRYAGTQADSVIFNFVVRNGGAMQYTDLVSFIGNTKREYTYDLKDSYIQCTPAWKNGYSNDMQILQCTSGLLVFSVNQHNGASTGDVEIDSFKLIRYWGR